MSDPQTPGEQMAEDTVIAVQEAIDDWVQDDESTAHREGEELCIKEQELINKVTLMISMTVIEFTEN